MSLLKAKHLTSHDWYYINLAVEEFAKCESIKKNSAMFGPEQAMKDALYLSELSLKTRFLFDIEYKKTKDKEKLIKKIQDS